MRSKQEKHLNKTLLRKSMNLNANNLYRLFAFLLILASISALFAGQEKLADYGGISAFLLLFFKREIFNLFKDLFGVPNEQSI